MIKQLFFRKSSKSVPVKEFVDPLSAMLGSSDVLDPLTALSISNSNQSKLKKLDNAYEKVFRFSEWILNVNLPLYTCALF